eukprot:990473-Pleurochrysis_carterae.AAC.4
MQSGMNTQVEELAPARTHARRTPKESKGSTRRGGDEIESQSDRKPAGDECFLSFGTSRRHSSFERMNRTQGGTKSAAPQPDGVCLADRESERGDESDSRGVTPRSTLARSGRRSSAALLRGKQKQPQDGARRSRVRIVEEVVKEVRR